MNSNLRPEEISSILEKELTNFSPKQHIESVGTVLQVGDGIARVYGLGLVEAGERVLFQGGQEGVAINLEENHVGVVVLGPSDAIKEGDRVSRTEKKGSVAVGQGLIGRILDGLGKPIDGKGAIDGPTVEMPLERKAPGVIYRESVSEPLQTGIKVIDSMIPIGRGQRQLIVGDRQTGKTTIALDAIINQRRNFEKGEPVFCIYVAIGQRAASVAQVAGILEAHGAMDYTVIVSASAADPSAIQYLAPFSGTAIGEYFRDCGKNALIVYDDLSKQAIAYREISLLLRRPPGREAYPGDIFYLHSRILERSAKLNRDDDLVKSMESIPEDLLPYVKGGGSLTALPIIETQEGDVSAYIPTNVISITDGQIFLEGDLFNSGIRPAVNIGVSVSRVGGSAQIKAMKKVAGTLKLEQAQFMEFASFAKFGSDVDQATRLVIERGEKTQELLKQPPHQPVAVEEQIVTLYASTKGYIDHVPMEKIHAFVKAYWKAINDHIPEILEPLQGGILDQEMEQKLEIQAKALLKKFS